MNPLVSVIMPVYNSAKYVKKSINSVLEQSYQNIELIIVDDGSTDESAQIIKELRDPRVRYQYQENKGVQRLAETINAGLSKASGKYVTMMPSDDLWPNYRLSRQVPLMEANPEVVLCFGKQKLIDPEDNEIGETKPPRELERIRNSPRGQALHEMFVWNYIPQPTVLIRKATLDKIGGYLQPSYLYAEDYPTHMELTKHGELLFIPEYFALYRLHPNQMTRTHYLKMVETDVKFVREFYKSLPDELKVNSGWEASNLERMLDRRLKSAHFQVGRQLLLKSDRKGARENFVKALLGGDRLTKLKSAAGLACTLTGFDLEKLTALTGRSAPLKSGKKSQRETL
ncbi:MAG: hypothetical protein COT74_11070 [Bdellovibrionales bacterium CG10_big_fil_rev_8_21_14_0_10_45_34]|nr:MAG: hypothetical protein COT74_11070 [Bdellovibrionales bacterium CG10_big_fil_rev_8_21_14_0_10_45_34]